MVARSDLPRFGPFRTGLDPDRLRARARARAPHTAATSARGSESLFGRLIGTTGTRMLGGFVLLAGVLLVSGASAGAFLRRSGHAMRRAARARPTRRAHALAPPLPVEADNVVPLPVAPPIDGVEEFPDVVAPPPLLVFDEEPRRRARRAAEPVRRHRGRRRRRPLHAPRRGVLRRSKGAPATAPSAARTSPETLVAALGNFGVDATVVGEIAGPRVTRYELQLAPGTKVSKVAGLKDDLSYALATTEIRILAPIPGKQAVGVEVPNHSPNIVTLGDIYDDLPATASPLSVWLGKDISGNAVWTDLARMPHLLIAGTTGSGKSGCINTILSSILLRATPDDVRMILIDPKRIELNFYESIPHLLTPVVSSPKTAAAALLNVVGEMERRYERMSHVRARGLPEMNRALRSRGEKPLPYLLVVIDELADLMMISPQEVEDAIIRLAQKSRAVGIHLVLATQRPSVDVITGMIKANVPSRIAFAVSSQTDSRVILDQAGRREPARPGRHAVQAARYLAAAAAPGRLRQRGGGRAARRAVPRAARAGARRVDARGARSRRAGRTTTIDGEFDPDEDPLLEKAIEVVVQAQTASVSLLQRRLRVGYTRAGRLIDMLERRGIISPYEGSKPRRVLVGEGDLAQTGT